MRFKLDPLSPTGVSPEEIRRDVKSSGAVHTGARTLNDLNDVNVSGGATNNQALSWDSATQRWIPKTVSGSGSGIVETIVAGTNVTVDATDPANPIVSATGGGAVDSVNAQTGAVVLDTDDIADTATNRYTDDTAITRLANTSGTNTGDQDLSGLVPYTGATADLNLATHDIITDTARASTSAGLLAEASNGTDVGLLGAGNTANVAWYGAHNFALSTQDTIAAFTGAGKTLGSLALATYPSLTELSYVKGVTSALQAQLNNKQPLATVLTNTTASFTTADETKLDGIEAGADVTDATNVAAAGAVMEADTSTASMSFVIDEDNMASNLATKVPTQQSVKAYVDNERLFYNVKDYGAVGDGSTNDRTSIQTAIDAAETAGGGIVYFPHDGPYMVSSKLYWRDNVTLKGVGSTTIKASSGIDTQVIGIENQDTTPAIVNVGAVGIIFDGNKASSPGLSAPSVVSLDPVDGGYFEDCVFQNSRGYGMSLQYTSAGVPDNERVKNLTFVSCDFNNNGDGLASGGTTYDGIDVKNCNGIKMISCRAFSNSLDGFDFRGINVELVSCEAYSNGGSGAEISANTNGNNQDASMRIIGGYYHDNADGVLIANNPAGGTGITKVDITGASIYSNTDAGIDFSSSNSNTYAKITAHIFNNTVNGIDIPSSAKQVIIDSSQIVSNGGSGVYVNGTNVQINGGYIGLNTSYGYEEGASATRNIISGSAKIFDNTAGNILMNSASRLSTVSPDVRDYTPNSSTIGDIIASAATITLPHGGRTFFITGTTTITSITASYRGRRVTLVSASTAGMTDGSNLKLASDFVAVADDTITLICDGTNWHEVSRSNAGSWASWTPTLTGFSADPTSAVYRYTQVGKMVTLTIRQSGNGTSNATTFTATLPVTAKTTTNNLWTASGVGTDNGVSVSVSSLILSGGTTVAFYTGLLVAGAWTASGGKKINAITITYEAA